MNTSSPNAIRRDPATVMRLSRLGSLHQCRLSFMRILTRRMARETWSFSRPVFEIDSSGVGHAVYTATGPDNSYSLVAFAHDLPAEKRSDRVIANAWDATFTLYDGIPTDKDIERLAKNVPLQEAGRISESELSLSRANRSVRLWDHVVNRLADGQQPDTDLIDKVGYLMRTTAVYGSGKFGAADREAIADRDELQAPFQVEMLSVFLTRSFVRDLIQHIAESRGGTSAVRLDRNIARSLGIGNSTGLGMAPFIINHPVLFNNWILAREEALARVRSSEQASAAQISLFLQLLQCSEVSLQNWRSEHPIQIARLADLRRDIRNLTRHVESLLPDQNGDDRNEPPGKFWHNHPWDALIRWSESRLSEEGQELLVSLVLEPHSALIDDLSATMADNSSGHGLIDGSMSTGELRDLLHDDYDWALSIDWTTRESCARLWYTSAEKLEPRLGERFEEPLMEYEQPLAPARDIAAMYNALLQYPEDTPICEFLLIHPEHRHSTRRAQLSRFAPYGEIRDNTISGSLLPIDMLRAKLSFFGATHFDPRSDRWVRISMYANAPYPEELTLDNADFWVYSGYPL